jgi:hypothetical protein
VKMNAMASPAQSERYARVLEPTVEAPAVSPADLKDGRLPNRRRSRDNRAALTLSVVVIAFCIGVTAAWAWQSYGDVAREMIAASYPQLGWLAPRGEPATQNTADMIAATAPAAPSFDQQQLDAISIDVEAVRKSIDRIAPDIAASQEQVARNIDRIAAAQEEMVRTVGQLTASQEQLMREITQLQMVEQYVLYKNTQPPPRPAPGQARNRILRSSQAPTVR